MRPNSDGLQATEARLRATMAAESTVDLDEHAHLVAVTAVRAKRRVWSGQVHEHVVSVRDRLAGQEEARR